MGSTDTGPNNPTRTETPAAKDSTETATATPEQTATPEPTPTPTPTPDALDLREYDAGVEQLNASLSTPGEVDRNDPQDGERHYEPITFVGEGGERYNITTVGSNDNQYLELRSPDGEVIQAGSGPSPDENVDTALTNVTLPETGQYTLRVYAADGVDEQFFTYSVSINRIPSTGEVERAKPGVFAGNKTYWNESEKYTFWAHNLGYLADGNGYATDVEKSVAVNPEHDYAVITIIGGTHYEPEDRQTVLVDVLGAYRALYDDFAKKNVFGTDESFVPDRTYVRVITPEERQNFRYYTMTLEGYKTGNMFTEWLASNRLGPAHPDYEAGNDRSAETLNDYIPTDRDAEVSLKPNPWVNNTNERIDPVPPENETTTETESS